MAVQKGVQSVSFQSGGAIAQYIPVKLDSASNLNKVLAVTAATDKVVGFSQLDATENQEIPIATSGIVYARVGSGGVTKNDYVLLDGSDPTEVATYTPLATSSTGGTRRQIIGTAQESGVENDIIPILLDMFTDLIA